MNSTLLIIMNPRAIPECIDALRNLRGIDKAWCSYYTETDLEHIIPAIIQRTTYDRYTIISDDTTPTQSALDAILKLHDRWPNAVTTGWCNLDAVSNKATYNPTPLRGSAPSPDAYTFTTIDKARRMQTPARTYFHGFVLATMNRELALRYPFQTFNGCASDLHQCYRLQADGVPILTTPDGEVHHVKEVANLLDTAPHKRLLINERPARVTLELEHNV